MNHYRGSWYRLDFFIIQITDELDALKIECKNFKEDNEQIKQEVGSDIKFLVIAVLCACNLKFTA